MTDFWRHELSLTGSMYERIIHKDFTVILDHSCLMLLLVKLCWNLTIDNSYCLRSASVVEIICVSK